MRRGDFIGPRNDGVVEVPKLMIVLAAVAVDVVGVPKLNSVVTFGIIAAPKLNPE